MEQQQQDNGVSKRCKVSHYFPMVGAQLSTIGGSEYD
jgi:hypothetical protein